MTLSNAHSMDFGGEVVTFSIERTSRKKTVAISVGYDGVRVLAPLDLDNDQVVKIVRRKGPWLLRKQAGYREFGGAAISREFVSGETFHYLGRPYRLKLVRDEMALLSRIVARGSSLIAPVLPDAGPIVRRAAVRGALRHWYRDHAKLHFTSRVALAAEKLGITTPSVRVVDQSKRWGSCDANGRLRLNWRLIMAPMALVDYVIAHEACHVLEHNHSQRFWHSLETIMPDYESRVRRLDALGHLYVW
jgi:predicted metal-dependent hydrolase